MAEMLKLAEQYAILSEAERSLTVVRVLKHGDTFAVFDPHGDVVPAPASEHGLYHVGTRFLSRFELLLARRQPLLLSSLADLIVIGSHGRTGLKRLILGSVAQSVVAPAHCSVEVVRRRT